MKSSLVRAEAPSSATRQHRSPGMRRKRLARPDLRRARARGPLGRYADAAGRLHEVVALAGAAGSVLVVDRDAITLAERRLVAHLAADEPAQNAQMVCAHYLADASRGRCRPVLPADLEHVPHDEDSKHRPATERELLEGRSRRYRLEAVAGAHAIPDLRWVALDGAGRSPISARDVIAALESYEPVRSLTGEALRRHRDDPMRLGQRASCGAASRRPEQHRPQPGTSRGCPGCDADRGHQRQ